jgi:hypothetical protein
LRIHGNIKFLLYIYEGNLVGGKEMIANFMKASAVTAGVIGFQLLMVIPNVAAHPLSGSDGSRLVVGSVDEAFEIAFLVKCDGTPSNDDGTSLIARGDRKLSFELSFSEPTGTIAEQTMLFVLGDKRFQSVRVPFAEFGSGPAIPMILQLKNVTRLGCRLASSFGRTVNADTGATLDNFPEIIFSSDMHEETNYPVN